MNRPEALSLLSLTGQPSPLDVRTAFRVKAVDLTKGVLKGVSADDLRAARDVLTISTENDFPPCLICRGRGKVQAGFNTQPCVVCAGSGERRT